MWIRQHGKRTDDDKIIFNCVRKLMKNKGEKEVRIGLNFTKVILETSIQREAQLGARLVQI